MGNHAIFLTPDADAWKTAAQAKLYAGLLFLETYQNSPLNKLGFVWRYAPASISDYESGTPGFQEALWQHHYLVVELHKGANCKLLTGAQHTKYVQIADWAVAQPIRYINESVAGEWRSPSYETTVGRSGTTIDSLDTWGQQFAWQYTDAPPPASGPWLKTSFAHTLWSSATVNPDLAGAYYNAYFWAAVCAAVERGISGADAAWQKIYGTNPTSAAPNANLTTLATWANGFASDPRWGLLPRNK